MVELEVVMGRQSERMVVIKVKRETRLSARIRSSGGSRR